MQRRFLVVSLNPTIQRTLCVRGLNHGQVNRVLEKRVGVGGKGAFVSRVLGQLGAECAHLSPLGGVQQTEYLEYSRKAGIEVIGVDAPIEIRTCVTVLDVLSGCSTEIVEEGSRAGDGFENDVMECFTRVLPEAHTVLLCGSKLPGCSDEIYASMTAMSRSSGVTVYLDIRGRDLLRALPNRPDVVKINVSEFASTLGLSVPEHTPDRSLPVEIEQGMLEWSFAYGASIVLTNGPESVLYTCGARVERYRPPVIEPVNPIGSGDAFLAGLAWAKNRGMGIEESIEFAGECARKSALLEEPGTIVG